MGAVQLRAGWDFAKNRAKLKDAYVIEAEKRLAEVVLNILRVSGKDLKITTADFDVNIPHSPQDNMQVKAQVLQMLLQSGINPLVCIRTCGLWNDAEKVYLNSKPYLDALYKTIDDKINELGLEEEQRKAEEILDNINNQQEKKSTVESTSLQSQT